MGENELDKAEGRSIQSLKSTEKIGLNPYKIILSDLVGTVVPRSMIEGYFADTKANQDPNLVWQNDLQSIKSKCAMQHTDSPIKAIFGSDDSYLVGEVVRLGSMAAVATLNIDPHTLGIEAFGKQFQLNEEVGQEVKDQVTGEHLQQARNLITNPAILDSMEVDESTYSALAAAICINKVNMALASEKAAD